jgi:hypothetical protein
MVKNWRHFEELLMEYASTVILHDKVYDCDLSLVAAYIRNNMAKSTGTAKLNIEQPLLTYDDIVKHYIKSLGLDKDIKHYIMQIYKHAPKHISKVLLNYMKNMEKMHKIVCSCEDSYLNEHIVIEYDTSTARYQYYINEIYESISRVA